MLSRLIPGLLAAAMILSAQDRMQIGIRLESPPSMPACLLRALIEETDRQWEFRPLRLQWHRDSGTCRGGDQRLLIVRLKGSCSLKRRGPSPPGTLGFTHVSDNHVLPFIEIDCSAVASSISRGLPSTSSFLNPEQYARALAAVLTHEMVHALTGSRDHGSSGVMRSQLSPRELVEPDLALAPETIERLEAALGIELLENSASVR